MCSLSMAQEGTTDSDESAWKTIQHRMLDSLTTTKTEAR